MSDKTRVLLLSTAYLPQIGGSELAIKNITDRLPEIEFDLITSRKSKNLPPYERIGNVNVYRVGSGMGLFSFLLPKNFFPIPVFFKARRLVRKRGGYDLIHAYQASQAAGGGYLLKWLYPQTPFLLTVQEGKLLNRQPWLLRFFRHLIFEKVDHATAISNYLAKYVKSQNSKIPVTVIPNGVDLNKFSIFNFQFSNKKEKNEKIIITVSRLVEKNGVGDLIDAFSMLNTKYLIQNTKLIIIGDGPLRESLKFKVKNLKLEDGVLFVGEAVNEELPDYLVRADVFVRPSLSEGLGVSFLEAMAAGVPIVGTPVGGIPDFLENGVTGLFCKPGNPEDIADKIKLILSDKNLRENIIINARRLVEEKYDWNKIAKRFKELYGNL